MLGSWTIPPNFRDVIVLPQKNGHRFPREITPSDSHARILDDAIPPNFRDFIVGVGFLWELVPLVT